MVFVTDIAAPHLSDDDHHHLARVRRIRAGDGIVLADGTGAWCPAAMAGHEPEVTGPIVRLTRSEPPIAVGFALSKGEKPELCVQKLTELGIDRIRPFVASRSVVRWDGSKRAAALERFQRIAKEAAMQSRSAWIPEVDPIVGFAEIAADGGVSRADRGGGAPTLESGCILVGPEGGWDEHERSHPMPTVSLAEGVLRAETAAIVAGAILSGLRAGVVAAAQDPV